MTINLCNDSSNPPFLIFFKCSEVRQSPLRNCFISWISLSINPLLPWTTKSFVFHQFSIVFLSVLLAFSTCFPIIPKNVVLILLRISCITNLQQVETLSFLSPMPQVCFLCRLHRCICKHDCITWKSFFRFYTKPGVIIPSSLPIQRQYFRISSCPYVFFFERTALSYPLPSSLHREQSGQALIHTVHKNDIGNYN